MLGLYEDEDLKLNNLGRIAPSHAQDEEASSAAAATDTTASATGIVQVLGYRVHLRNEQWQVRWATEEPGAGAASSSPVVETSWECYAVLDTELLRKDAERWRVAKRKI